MKKNGKNSRALANLALGITALLFSSPDAFSQTGISIGTAEARPADVRKGKTPGLEVTLPPDVQKLIETDPLKAARPVKANIDTWGARVAKSVREFDELAKDLDLRRIDHQKVALGELRQLLNEVEEAADAILEGYAPFQTNFELYARALAQAPATFTALAESCQKKAGEQEHQNLAGVYADFAETNRRLAKRYVARHEELVKQQQDVEQKIRFVRQSKTVIKDIKDLLDVIPATDEADAVEAYVRRVNEYVDGFLKVIHAVKGTADKISETKAPESPGTVKPLPLHGRLNERPPPIGTDEYRSRLAALQR